MAENGKGIGSIEVNVFGSFRRYMGQKVPAYPITRKILHKKTTAYNIITDLRLLPDKVSVK